MHDEHGIPVELRDPSLEIDRFPFVDAVEELPAASEFAQNLGELHLTDLPEPYYDDSEINTPIAEPTAPVELGQAVAISRPLGYNSSLSASTDSTAEQKETENPVAKESLADFPIEAIEQMRLHDQERSY